ncbi:MAG: creatininase family protein [Candidatus Poribacteria bacterium]|nr:creatininase family protein [Candidatus Poribacteria bacterium]
MSNNYIDAATATWQECHDFLQRHPFAILPLGATEQHGLHLPQNTDSLIAEAIALQVGKKSVGMILPTIPIGYSWVWRDYPGSLTFSFDTFRSVIKDIVVSLDRNRCRALLILTTHGANPQPIKYASRELVDHTSIRVLRAFYPNLSQIITDADSTTWQASNFHAEEFETSLMLYLHPNLVDMTKAVSEYPPYSLDYEMSTLPMGALSESGVFGDATVATVEKGEKWFNRCVANIVQVWSEFLDLPNDESSDLYEIN